MAIYKLSDEKIVKLNTTTFAKEKINEATDLQKFIANSIEVIDPNLFVISTEFCDWEDSKRR
jgi:predicted class III extradiol MEMO1 family dioxygenase